MTLRANLHIAALSGLIAVAGTAVLAKGGDHAEIFGKIDADGNGQITQAELSAHAEARFKAADANNDGALDATEMLAQRGERGAKRAAQLLEKYDADKNGALDAAELEKAAAERGGKRGKHGNRIMKRLDADGDGKLTLAEMQQKRDPAKMIKRLDADGNGTLSAEEFAKVRQHRKGRGKKKSGE